MAAGPPCPEQSLELPANLWQIGRRPLDVLQLDVDEAQDVGARDPSRTLEYRDLLDLVQPETEASSLGDKDKRCQCVIGVDSVTRPRAARRGQDAPAFVEAERLTAYAAVRRNFTDQQPVPRHAWRVNPAPWGNVKWICNRIRTTSSRRSDPDTCPLLVEVHGGLAKAARAHSERMPSQNPDQHGKANKAGQEPMHHGGSERHKGHGHSRDMHREPAVPAATSRDPAFYHSSVK